MRRPRANWSRCGTRSTCRRRCRRSSRTRTSSRTSPTIVARDARPVLAGSDRPVERRPQRCITCGSARARRTSCSGRRCTATSRPRPPRCSTCSTASAAPRRARRQADARQPDDPCRADAESGRGGAVSAGGTRRTSTSIATRCGCRRRKGARSRRCAIASSRCSASTCTIRTGHVGGLSRRSPASISLLAVAFNRRSAQRQPEAHPREEDRAIIRDAIEPFVPGQIGPLQRRVRGEGVRRQHRANGAPAWC